MNFIELKRSTTKRHRNYNALGAVKLDKLLNHRRATSFLDLIQSITFCIVSKGVSYFVVIPFQVTNFPAAKRLKKGANALI